jgi:glutathione S-transferase
VAISHKPPLPQRSVARPSSCLIGHEVVLTVYRVPFSTNVERVALAAAYKGVELEYVDVPYDDRTEVVRVSGQELVPVLVDGDVVLSDSPVILEHLEARFPEPPLFPRDPPRREELRIFLDWFNRIWKRPPNLIAAEELEPEPDRERIAELEGRVAASLDRFEALLTGRDYLFGHALTAADVTSFPFLKYAVLWDEGDEHRFHEILRDAMPLEGRYPRLEAWIHRIDGLPRA